MDLYLIRHPRPTVDVGVCYGRTDMAVEEEHLLEAIQRLQLLLPRNFQVWSSPLTRCRRLSERLHVEPRFDDRLMEMNFGAWELKSWDQIERAAIDAWANDPLDFISSGGEFLRDLCTRVAAFLDDVADESVPLVLVTHAGVMRAAAAHLLGNVDWMRMPFEFHYGNSGIVYTILTFNFWNNG